MQVNIQPDVESIVARLMREGGFSSPESVVNALIRLQASMLKPRREPELRLPDPPILMDSEFVLPDIP
jgi:hypothetical protein